MGWEAFRVATIPTSRKLAFEKILNDVPRWPRWDVDLVSATITDGSTVPAKGTKGEVSMKNGRTFPMEFVDVRHSEYVAYRTIFPGAALDWFWQLENETTSAEGKPSFQLKMGVKCNGFLSFAYSLALKSMCLEAFDKCLPEFQKVAAEVQKEAEGQA
ncbi:hypothetical protein DFJ74DRAFT_660464 [Hyaloraphidium curvatum]|nr:hypothetical protein DFJ74DRAFT_660464 [Hyaloraphidium curvatum]